MTGIVVEHQAIDLGAPLPPRDWLTWPDEASFIPCFSHDNLPGTHAFVQSHQLRGIEGLICHHREDGQYFVCGLAVRTASRSWNCKRYPKKCGKRYCAANAVPQGRRTRRESSTRVLLILSAPSLAPSRQFHSHRILLGLVIVARHWKNADK